jgi:hypothetical protein
VLNADLLNSFVGHRIELRPAAGRDALRDATQGTDRGTTRLVAAAVTGVTERSQLRLETDDIKVVDFKDRAVYAEVNTSLNLLRVQGMLEVLVLDPPPAVCVLTPFDRPGAIERRQWVRVRTELPVGIACRGSTDADGGPVRTVSVDLSGGGIRLRAGPGREVGSRMTLAVELPSGPVEVEGEVLEVGRNGMTRLQFLNMSEAARKRIFRHVFDVQRKIRKPAP